MTTNFLLSPLQNVRARVSGDMGALNTLTIVTQKARLNSEILGTLLPRFLNDRSFVFANRTGTSGWVQICSVGHRDLGPQYRERHIALHDVKVPADYSARLFNTQQYLMHLPTRKEHWPVDALVRQLKVLFPTRVHFLARKIQGFRYQATLHNRACAFATQEIGYKFLWQVINQTAWTLIIITAVE